MNAAQPPALWTAAEILSATGGQGKADFTATGVAFDTRTLAPGDLFFALPGETRDGHEFVADAIAKGAAAAVVARMPPGVAASAPLVWVEDTQAALTRLAEAARARFAGQVFAITGSVGKTTTKEALRHVLEAYGPAHASPKSFNNAIGVPVTLAGAPRGARFLAAEIGMNQPGEIAPLSRLVRPHVAVITAIEPVHIGFFGTLGGIAAEKADIFAGLADGGTAIVPADSAHAGLLMRRAEDFGADRILTFGERASHARLVAFRGDAEGSDVECDLLARRIRFRIGAPGRHIAMNAVAVLAALLAAGLDPLPAAARMETFRAVSGRGAQRVIATGNGQALLLDESYNASVPSVRAALSVLAMLPAKRRIAVLGDMLELGDHGPSMHEELAEAAAEAADLVFTCGPLMELLHRALPDAKRGAHAATSEALAPLVKARLRDGDAVMVKGSLGMRMAAVVRALGGDPAGGG
jgi:UDP-N-acetylmuramoyl-tripeptide--D-alanyl-D-alanine ligase